MDYHGLILYVTREPNVNYYNMPFRGEVGKFKLGAHLRERGQKPGILRQVGEGRDYSLPF